MIYEDHILAGPLFKFVQRVYRAKLLSRSTNTVGSHPLSIMTRMTVCLFSKDKKTMRLKWTSKISNTKIIR